jgi:carboxylesterase type B
MISSYWVNFAATGDPNGNELPGWPPFDAKTNMRMILGDKVEPGPGLTKEELAVYQALYDRVRK